MFNSIRTKLFALILLTNGVMVLLLLSFNAFSFNRSFSNYVEQREQKRLSVLIERIALAYESEGNWKWLRDEPTSIISLLENSSNSNNGPRVQERSFRPGYADQLRIRDAQGRPVYGRPPNGHKIIWLPIENSRQRVFGQLGVELNSRFDAQSDAIFVNQLRQQLYVIGLLVFVIAAGFAIPFSGWLVQPIQRITHAMRQLSGGDFNVTVRNDRQDELGQLATDFNQMALVLRKAQSDRQQWVSDIAHELRTPVAVLQADIEAAQDGIRQVDDTWLATLYTHSERLKQLVNDLHQLSQSDAGALSYRFERVDLRELTEQVIGQFKTSFENQYIDVVLSSGTELIELDGDVQRLAQLLTNLAQNTLRYTEGSAQQPGQLRIDITQAAGDIQLHWQDSAPSVAPEHLDKLFDRLYRVDESRSRLSGGSGLGLAIAKNIVEAHQGQIEARRSELGGLLISLTLPCVKESEK
ncbi:ATP-binding protein [Reinekea thalattae]|uniref:histidine kinase n=1 Tax=Reinekea thalattae TaxID=2593301 RepID=A0A5C8Z212_9GAMM|nr:ATP-binding protein [Reinekea thalattae]TXR51334.1 HAMP domain-containing protein [Reinekea thalattae]